MNEGEFITKRESGQRWDAHRDLHAAHDKAHDQEHDMTEAALDKAVASMDRRLETMNEFRASLRDQQATFVRTEAFQQWTDRVVALEKQGVRGEGRGQGYSSLIGWIIAAVGFVTGVIVLANLLTGGQP